MTRAQVRPQVRFVRRAGRLLSRGLGTPCPQDLALADAGHAYDSFGAHRDWVVLGHALTARLYDYWFRVRSSGIENVPAEGPVILVANHSGGLPYDGAMIWTDVLRNTCVDWLVSQGMRYSDLPQFVGRVDAQLLQALAARHGEVKRHDAADVELLMPALRIDPRA